MMAAPKVKAGVPVTGQLYNTLTARRMSGKQLKAIANHPMSLEISDLKYPLGNLPANFNPYWEKPTDMSPADIARWFVRTDSGELLSVVSYSDDQAACGACWAFSASAMFSSRIRAALIRRYGQKACVMSSLFQQVDYCTGETGIEPDDEGGVVNVNPQSVYGIETCNRISPYYTATFAPEITQTCAASDVAQCIDPMCRKALMAGSGIKGTVQHADLHVALGAAEYGQCLGCGGNSIAMPLILFTGTTEDTSKGAATIEDFGIFDWACIFGDKTQQAKFCPAGLSTGEVRLLKADSYIYVTPDVLSASNQPPMSGTGETAKPIRTMEQLIMHEVYNYGPVTVGFNVFDSFQKFFNAHSSSTYDPNAVVYTADDFIADIHNPATAAANSPDSAGGHAVMIFGWGERPDPATGTVIKFWRVLNSWGPDWGNNGTFHIERNMDHLLAAAGLPQYAVDFENEMGSVYFAPEPNAASYPANLTNDMKTFFHTPEYGSCTYPDYSNDERKRITAECACPGAVCTAGIGKHHRSKGHRRVLIMILFIVLIVLALVLVRKSVSSKAVTAAPLVAAAATLAPVLL